MKKDFSIKASFIPHLNVIQCTVPTTGCEIWLQEEGKLVTALSEKGYSVTAITLPAPWFDICKQYCHLS